MPFFSVILPVYNVIPYLDRCIQSVLAQGFDDYELILVDDGSTDGSGELCDAYSARYNFVHVVHKENGGLSSARNAGLAEAKGQYIWWVDSDDWIEPDALHILYQASVANVPDIVKFNYIRCGEEAEVIESSANPGIYTEKDSLEQLMEKAFFTAGKYGLSAWANIYRRDFLERNNLLFVSERVIGSEDYLFNLEAFASVQSIHVIHAPLYNYEQRAGSLTHTYKKDLSQRYTKLYIQLKEYYSDKGILGKYEKWICAFYVWHLIHGTYIPHEYHVSSQHSLEDGRSNIRVFLGTPEFQYAVKHCDFGHFSWKQRIQLIAMQLKAECLMCYLFATKPKQKEGKYHENKN